MMNKFLALLLTLWALPSFGQDINLLKNSGFESGKARWTASGGSFTISTSNPYAGTNIASFDASASAQTLKSTLVAVGNGLNGRACIAGLWYKADSITAGDYTLYAEDSTSAALTSALSLNPTSGSWTFAYVAFVCPSAATTIRLVVASAVSNPVAITLDEAWLGSQMRSVLVQDPAEIVAAAHFPGAVNCSWSRSNTAMGGFGIDTDCPGITVDVSSPIVSINTTNTNFPKIVFTSLPAGIYELKAMFSGRPGTATNIATFGLSDETTVYDSHIVDGDATNSIITLVGTFSHAGGAKTFRIECQSSANACVLDNSTAVGQAPNLTYQLTRFPTSSTSKVTLETQGWYVDANITGANPSLGTATVTSDTEVTDAGLTLTNNNSAVSVQIPCSTTNPPTGTTCAAGNESVGIAFTPPYAGNFLVCASFNSNLNANSTVHFNHSFRLNETSLSAQTVLQTGKEGSTARFDANSANETQQIPHKFCNIFSFTSVSQKVIRVMYQQHDVSGTPLASAILADNTVGTGDGGNQINLKIIPLTQQFPQAVALTSVATGGSSGCLNGENFCVGSYTPTITNGSNVVTSTPHLVTYQRIGNQVCEQGSVDIDPSLAANTATSFTMSLAVASDLVASTDLSGTEIGSNSGGQYQAGQVTAATATDKAQFDFAAGDNGNRAHTFNFCYRILP